ncbi:MAG: SRPBCC family protein [Caldilineaceae bacterium]|nr:SRPBCC family protein [Caldilineaceae bacterium]
MLIEHRVQIAAPAAYVFDCLNDVDRLPQWMDGLQRTEIPASFDPANPVGGSYQQHMVQFGYPLRYTVTVTRFESARAVDLNLDSRYFMLDIHYSLLENAPDLTELHCRAEISRTDWSVRVLQQLIADKMLHVLRLQMEAFRQMVEKGV